MGKCCVPCPLWEPSNICWDNIKGSRESCGEDGDELCLTPCPPNSFDHGTLPSNTSFSGERWGPGVKLWEPGITHGWSPFVSQRSWHMVGSQAPFISWGSPGGQTARERKAWWRRSPWLPYPFFLGIQRTLPEYYGLYFCFSFPNHKDTSSSHSF